jgi:hypothetical protein
MNLKCLGVRAQAPASRFFFGTDFNNSTDTEAANQRARKSIERAAHVQFNQIFRRFSIYNVFSATLRLSITALFREPKAREDHSTLMPRRCLQLPRNNKFDFDGTSHTT